MLKVLKSKLHNISVWKSRLKFLICGKDEENRYHILEVKCPVGILVKDDTLEIAEDQITYSSEEFDAKILDLQMTCSLSDSVAIYGFIRLVESYYLIMITKSTPIASIHGHIIHTISETVTIPIIYKIRNTVEESRYRSIISKIDFTIGYYFSFTYDITNSLQRNTLITSEDLLNESFPCNDIFVWNHYPLQLILSFELWIIPVIYGFIKQFTYQSNIH